VLDRNVLKCPMFFSVKYIYFFLYFSVLESVFLISYIFQNTTIVSKFSAESKQILFIKDRFTI